MFLKITLVILLLIFWGLSLWVVYVAGMSRGFQNFMSDRPDHKFDRLDAAIYENISGKKLDHINPVAEMIADKRIQDFKDKKKIEKRNAVISKIKKKRSKKKK
jgi:hypothetical protein